jgi:2-polyprenyl-3-methyl-5-hydroxy-6-metoxy-1,4-benzoquinol methylase
MAPTPPQTRKDIGMEGVVAKWYAANTGKTLEEFTKLARLVRSQIPPGRVLDVAAGPGYFSIELAKLGEYSIAGLDISRTFVEFADALLGTILRLSVSAARR